MQNNFGKIVTASALALGVFSAATLAEGATVSEEPISRIQGDNRFETAALISSGTYETADTVIIANAREFADALAGVPLAYQKNAPILLGQGNALRADTTSEISRLGASKAIILGGEAAVSQGIEKELTTLGLSVERLAGDNRFETAEIIAAELTSNKPSNAAVVVDGFEFADAMSVAPYAAREGMPIYLTRSNRLVSEDAMKQYSDTFIIGGTTAVSKAVETNLNNPTRLYGANRYSTNIAVMDYFGINSDHLFISTGQDFVDALTGSVLAAQASTGIALVRNDINSDLNNFIDANDFAEFTLLGGAAAVPEQVSLSLESYLTEKEFIKNVFTIENEVPFLTEEVENNQVPEGENKVLQEGIAGYDEVTYEVTIKNGQEVSRKELNRVTHEPVEEIVEIGAQVITSKTMEEIENHVDYEVIIKEDDQLPKGETRIEVEGVKGYDKVIYEIFFAEEQEIKRIENDRKTINPINEIKVIGTQVTEVIKETVRENYVNYGVLEEENEYVLVGQSELMGPGEYGYDNVLYEVTYVNGLESVREEIEREVIAPVNEKVLIGTRDSIIKKYSLRSGFNNQGYYSGIFESTTINGVDMGSKMIASIDQSYSSRRVSSFTRRYVLPFRSVEIEDDTMVEGEREVITAGQNGVEEVKYTNIYLDNNLVFSGEESQTIIERPINEIIAIGNQ